MVSRSLLTGAFALAAAGCGRVGFGGDDPGDGGAYQSEVMTDGPVAYFRFDETSGPTARSSVGAITGAYEGKFQFGQPGAVDGNPCVRFDGKTTRISLGDVLPFAGNAPYSIELWINAVDDLDTRFITDRRTKQVPRDGYTFYMGTGYFLAARLTAGVEMGYVNYETLPLDTWVHAALTYDGAFHRLYIDGVQFQKSNTSAATAIGGDEGYFTIGDTEPPQFNKLDAYLDELAIYDKALSAEQIARHFAARP